MRIVRTGLVVVILSLLLGIPLVSAQDGSEVLTVYSGRSESLLGPILQQFSEDTGVELEILYGDTAGLASQLLVEGENSPADVYIAQDGGALGALGVYGKKTKAKVNHRAEDAYLELMAELSD